MRRWTRRTAVGLGLVGGIGGRVMVRSILVALGRLTIMVVLIMIGIVTTDVAYLRAASQRRVLKTEVFHGANATKAIEALRAAHPDQIAKHQQIEGKMLARGFKRAPEDDVYIRHYHDPIASGQTAAIGRLVSWLAPALYAQDVSDGDGSVSMQPWDTGDNNTYAAEEQVWSITFACSAQGDIMIDITTGNSIVISASGSTTDSAGSSVLGQLLERHRRGVCLYRSSLRGGWYRVRRHRPRLFRVSCRRLL